MDPITLSFNVDLAKLRSLGIDPATSEGKQALRAIIIACLNDGVMGEGMAWGGRTADIVRVLLGEDAV